MKKNKTFNEINADIPRYKFMAYKEIKDKKILFFRRRIFFDFAPLPMYIMLFFNVLISSVCVYLYIGYHLITSEGFFEMISTVLLEEPIFVVYVCIMVALVPLMIMAIMLVVLELYAKWVYNYDRNDKYLNKRLDNEEEEN